MSQTEGIIEIVNCRLTAQVMMYGDKMIATETPAII